MSIMFPETEATGWEPLTHDRQDATQAALEDIIGLSQETFAASVFAAQGARHFADPSTAPRERKQLLSAALGLDRWNTYLIKLRTDLAVDTANLNEARGKLAALTEGTVDLGELRRDLGWTQATVDGAVESAREAENLLLSRRVALEEAAKASAALAQAQARAEQLRTVHERVSKQLDDATQAQVAVDTMRPRLTALSAAAAEAPALEAKLQEANLAATEALHAQNERQRLQDLARSAEGRQSKLQTDGEALVAQRTALAAENDKLTREGSGICPHCSQPVKGEHLQQAIRSNEQAIAALDEKLEETRAAFKGAMEENNAATRQLIALRETPTPEVGAVDALRRRLAEANSAATEAAVLQDRIAQARQASALLDDPEKAQALRHSVRQSNAERLEAENEIDRLLQIAPDDGLLRREVDRAETELSAARAEESRLRATLAATQERLRAAEALQARTTTLRTEIAALERTLAVRKRLEQAYGANGIPALILENEAIPQLEAETQRILREFDMPFRVELVTQRETKSGTLKDTLDVIVHGPLGALPYAKYSGGERTRIEVALRAALGRLMAAVNGTLIGIMVLDEPASLDATGQLALVRMLRGLTEFRSVVLVTHNETLADADFDERLVVVRDEAGARLEVAT